MRKRIAKLEKDLEIMETYPLLPSDHLNLLRIARVTALAFAGMFQTLVGIGVSYSLVLPKPAHIPLYVCAFTALLYGVMYLVFIDLRLGRFIRRRSMGQRKKIAASIMELTRKLPTSPHS
jgi:hypothetical protein